MLILRAVINQTITVVYCVCMPCVHAHLQASEDSIPEGSELNQMWSRSRALRLSELIVGQGLRTRGRDLIMLLGNAKDMFWTRYGALPCARIAASSALKPESASSKTRGWELHSLLED